MTSVPSNTSPLNAGGLKPTSLYKGPSTLLKPHPEVMRGFINWWFEFTTGTIEIAWRNVTDKKVREAAHFDIRDPALEAFACQVNSVDGQDTYFTPSVVSNASGRASDNDFVRSPGFWLDQDTIQDINYANSIDHEFRPTSYVYTGRTPDPRRQSWFRLEQPTADFNMVRETNRKLIGLYKGDPSVVNPSRLMRLPGSIAYPWKPGRTPELVTWEHPTDGRARSLSFASIKSLPDISAPILNDQPASNKPTVGERIRRIKADEFWHTNVNELIAHWVGRNYTDQEMLVWAADFTLDGYDIEQTEAEMQVSIDGARTKWDKPNVDRPAITKLEEAAAVFGDAPLDAQLDAPLPVRKQRDLEWMGGADLPIERIPTIVEDLIELAMTTVMFGPPGCGKTTVVVDLALHIAYGMPWCGRAVMQGPVVFYELEGKLGLRARINAWHVLHGIDMNANKAAFYCSYDNLALDKVDHITSIVEQAAEVKPILFVIDTLARSKGKLDENKDMSVITNTLNDIQVATNATGLLIHHPGKNPALGSRGGSDLKGNINTELEVTVKDGIIEVDNIKQKNFPEQPPLFFKKITVVIGQTPEGKPITGAAVQHISPEGAQATTYRFKAGTAEDVAWRTLVELGKYGTISREAALAEFSKDFYSGKKSKTAEPSRRSRFRKALLGFSKSGLITFNDTTITLISQDPAEVFGLSESNTAND